VRPPKVRRAGRDDADTDDEALEMRHEAVVQEALGHHTPGAQQMYEMQGMVMLMGSRKSDSDKEDDEGDI
jgi:hypothetical protein